MVLLLSMAFYSTKIIAASISRLFLWARPLGSKATRSFGRFVDYSMRMCSVCVSVRLLAVFFVRRTLLIPCHVSLHYNHGIVWCIICI